MADLDQLNVATHRYIQDNPALVDNFNRIKELYKPSVITWDALQCIMGYQR